METHQITELIVTLPTAISPIDKQLGTNLRNYFETFDDTINRLVHFCCKCFISKSCNPSGDLNEMDLFNVIEGLEIENNSIEEFSSLISLFKSSKYDTINIYEFIRGLKGGLNTKRLELVKQIWIKLDKSKSGIIHLKDARAKFNAMQHPRVKLGELDADKVLREFIEYWDYCQRNDGIIELIEWEYYFAGVSANIDTDTYFEKMITQCWPGLINTERNHPISTTSIFTPKFKRNLSKKLRKLESLIYDSQRFRTTLDFIFYKLLISNDKPMNKKNLFLIVNEIFSFVELDLDEESFENIFKRCFKDIERCNHLNQWDQFLKLSIKKELGFLEYQVYVRTAK